MISCFILFIHLWTESIWRTNVSNLPSFFNNLTHHPLSQSKYTESVFSVSSFYIVAHWCWLVNIKLYKKEPSYAKSTDGTGYFKKRKEHQFQKKNYLKCCSSYKNPSNRRNKKAKNKSDNSWYRESKESYALILRFLIDCYKRGRARKVKEGKDGSTNCGYRCPTDSR